MAVRRRAERLVAAALRLAAAGLPPPSHDAEQVREAVREVLSRPEFQRERPSPVEAAVQWVQERLGELLATLAEGGPGSVVGLVLFVVIVTALALIVTRFGLRLTRDPERAAALPQVPPRSAAEWQAEAERHERAGDWRAGLRCRYRALVALLAQRGLVDEVPGTTAGEYRAQVARNVPAAAAAFGGATELFELAWYGNRPTGRDEARRFGTLAERVATEARA